MEGCIFCKIVRGEIPSSKVYEDDNAMAFLDIMPANKGHTLVIPKKHYETLHDAPDDVLEKLIVAVKRISGAVVKATGADGFNVQENNRKASGQVVPHVHFHIIPRFEDDGLRLSWGHKKYDEGEMDRLSEAIGKNL